MLHVKSDDMIAEMNLDAERQIAEIDAKYLDKTETEATPVNHRNDPDIGAIVNWFGPFKDRTKAIKCAEKCGEQSPNNGLCLVTGVKRIKGLKDLFSRRKPKLQYVGASPEDISKTVTSLTGKRSNLFKRWSKAEEHKTLLNDLSKSGLEFWIGFLAEPLLEPEKPGAWPADVWQVRRALIYSLQPELFRPMKGAWNQSKVIVRNRWFSPEKKPLTNNENWCPDIIDYPSSPGPLSLLWVSPKGGIDREMIIHRNDSPTKRTYVWKKIRDLFIWRFSFTRSLAGLLALALVGVTFWKTFNPAPVSPETPTPGDPSQTIVECEVCDEPRTIIETQTVYETPPEIKTLVTDAYTKSERANTDYFKEPPNNVSAGETEQELEEINRSLDALNQTATSPKAQVVLGARTLPQVLEDFGVSSGVAPPPPSGPRPPLNEGDCISINVDGLLCLVDGKLVSPGQIIHDGTAPGT